MAPTLAVLLLTALSACSTSRALPRLSDDKILRKCGDVIDKVRFRDQFFKQARGSAEVEGLGVETDVELAINDRRELRMEFVGPLGVRLGMLQINSEWVMLYVPREKTVLRFPTSELYKNTARRDRFLRLLPIPVLPEAMFDSILTRVDLPGSLKVAQVQCGFDPDSQHYWLRVPSAPLANYKGGRWIWIEPHAFSPVEVQYFDAYLPEKNEVKQGRPLVRVSFSKVQNPLAPAAFPRKILLTSEDGKKLRFEWNRFEMVEAYNPKTFAWKPPASVEVKDY